MVSAGTKSECPGGHCGKTHVRRWTLPMVGRLRRTDISKDLIDVLFSDTRLNNHIGVSGYASLLANESRLVYPHLLQKRKGRSTRASQRLISHRYASLLRRIGTPADLS